MKNNNKLIYIVNSIVPTIDNFSSFSLPLLRNTSVFSLHITLSDLNVAILDAGGTCNFIQARDTVTNPVRVRKKHTSSRYTT